MVLSIGDFRADGEDMQIRTARDLGAVIRDRRKKKKLDQAKLAEMVGVSRKWIIDVEKGKPRAEMSLVLKTLEALGVPLFVDGAAANADADDGVDIDAIIANAKGGKR